jgi:hypothetical protein
MQRANIQSLQELLGEEPIPPDQLQELSGDELERIDARLRTDLSAALGHRK